MKSGGRVIQFHEGITYRENFKLLRIRNVLGKFFALGQKYKDERNDLMQALVKFLMNISYRIQISRAINHFYRCKSEHWMQTEYNCNVFIRLM